MNERFIIETQKTAETIKDFVLFKRRAQNSHATFHLCIISGGLIAMGYSSYAQDATAGINFLLIGLILLIFALFRHYPTISKFKKVDQAYLEKWALTYTFTNSRMSVYRNGELFENLGSYHNISSFYADEKNFYLGIKNEDMYVLPKRDFTTGTPEEFLSYISQKSGVECSFSPAGFFPRLKNSISVLKKETKSLS